MQPDRSVQSTLAFHASRIVIDIGVLIAMASMSMTFVTAPGGDRSALDADALPALLLLIPIFLVTLIPDHTRPLHPALGWLSLVLALAAVPYSFVKLLDAGVLADTLDGSVGLGPRLLLAGCVVTLVGVGIGLFRDLMGWPSGGTPGRTTTYTTKKAASPAERRPMPTQEEEEPAHAEPTEDDGDAPTRVITQQMPAAVEAEQDVPVEGDTRQADPPPARQRPTSFTAAQPEIVFPDTGAVAREAEPDEEPLASGADSMDTAERADAALTDHLRTMFDRPQGDHEGHPDEPVADDLPDDGKG